MPRRGDSSTLRPATLEDLDVLVELRVALFEAMGQRGPLLDAAVPAIRAYIEDHLPSGAFRVWVAERGGTVVAAIGLVIHSVPPSPHNPDGREAYIMNLFTRPEVRRRGIARRLMRHVLDVVQSEGTYKVRLYATPDGRPLYESLGFAVATGEPEMQFTLPNEDRFTTE